ncbi:MAG: histidine phosphatase family protein [Spirochaetia bacterium]
MKRIYILRHGKTEKSTEDKPDYERALLDAGREESRQIGLKMKNAGIMPEEIISSAAKRALETARLCIESWSFEKDIEASEALYTASAQDYIEIIRTLPEALNSVMLVGHNPTIEEFNEVLSGNYIVVKPAHLLWYELDLRMWSNFESGVSPARTGCLTP